VKQCVRDITEASLISLLQFIAYLKKLPWF